MMLNLDQSLYHLINQTLTNSVLDVVMFYFSEKYFWIPFYIIVIALLIKSYGKKSTVLIFFLVLSAVLSDRFTSGLMKPFFNRTRPCHVTELTPRIIEGVHCSDTGSMASSHASNHFAVAIFMIMLYGWSKTSNTLFWLLWAGSVAYSRIYLGVHYPSDVLVGAIVGVLLGLLCFKMYSISIKKLKWA
jgi:undecaprenyl-diphosphatase